MARRSRVSALDMPGFNAGALMNAGSDVTGAARDETGGKPSAFVSAE